MAITTTPDNDVPFAVEAAGLSDEELLNLWEHSQRMFLVLQMAMNADVEVRNGSEDAIVAELLRRQLRRGGKRTVLLARPRDKASARG